MNKPLALAALAAVLLSSSIACVHLLGRIEALDSKTADLAVAVGTNRAQFKDTDTERLLQIQAIGDLLQELGESDRLFASEVDGLSERLHALELRIAMVESAPDPSSISMVSQDGDGLEPEEFEDPLVEIAELSAQDALEVSSCPLVLFEDLPERAQDQFKQWKDKALFLEYPDNEWGRKNIGRVSYMVKGPQGWQREHVNETNTPLLQRLAELCYDIMVTTEARILELKSAGVFTRFSTREEAGPHIAARVNENPGPVVRVDPMTGVTYLFNGGDVRDYAPLVRLYEERETVGAKLLAGRGGQYGVRWVGVPGY